MLPRAMQHVTKKVVEQNAGLAGGDATAGEPKQGIRGMPVFTTSALEDMGLLPPGTAEKELRDYKETAYCLPSRCGNLNAEVNLWLVDSGCGHNLIGKRKSGS